MTSFITKWFDKIAHYLQMRFRLIRLDLVRSLSGILSYFLFSLVILFIALALLIFLGMGMSEFFADMLDSRAGGYFITTAIYLFVLIILFAFRKFFMRKFSGVFIDILTDDPDKYDAVDDDNDNEDNE
jgi:hypothetical protein